jgi:hypothetical protein
VKSTCVGSYCCFVDGDLERERERTKTFLNLCWIWSVVTAGVGTNPIHRHGPVW